MANASNHQKVKVGISIGDINGIGPEIILKTLFDAAFTKQFTPIIYTHPQVLDYYAEAINRTVNYNLCEHITDIEENSINVISVWQTSTKILCGTPTKNSAKCAVLSLEKATEHLLEKNTNCIVTAPLDKKYLPATGINFPGHTEYLASKTNNRALMILFHDTLRVALTTGHEAIKNVSNKLTKELILQRIKQFNYSLKQDFAIKLPKIAVLALNPHAGDNGRFGNEELQIIQPAIAEAKVQKIKAQGPFSADGFFWAKTYKNYDGILAMYHDQGLIPFKTIAGWNGVNFTAGLPIIRTSPDHGPAFDIAGKNIANAQSFKQAIAAAIKFFSKRTVHNK